MISYGGDARVIDGRVIAARVREHVATEVSATLVALGRPIGLATILVGNDPASAVYVTNKRRACDQVGIRNFGHVLKSDCGMTALLALIDELNDTPEIDGILCQLPLPPHLNASEVVARIDPLKDVDGLTLANAGRLAVGAEVLVPCTPLGVMRLLRECGISLKGAQATVVGRSNLFGEPMAMLLLAADATVTHCHRHTIDLPAACRSADVLVVAVGEPALVRGSWLKPGAVVIDVGITRQNSVLVGDVAFAEAIQVASRITPVPGGVGPMTIAMLLSNAVAAARLRHPVMVA